MACPPPDRPAEGHQPPRGALPLVPGRDLRREGAATETGPQRLHGAPRARDGRGSGRARGRARRGPVGRSGRGALRGARHGVRALLVLVPGRPPHRPGLRRPAQPDARRVRQPPRPAPPCPVLLGRLQPLERPLPLRRGGDRDGHGRRRDRRGLPGRPHWRQATRGPRDRGGERRRRHGRHRRRGGRRRRRGGLAEAFGLDIAERYRNLWAARPHRDDRGGRHLPDHGADRAGQPPRLRRRGGRPRPGRDDTNASRSRCGSVAAPSTRVA